jgi:hypothetical protein
MSSSQRDIELTRQHLRPRISAELRKGPRGGGRDRDQIVRHTYGSEAEFAKRIGVVWEPEVMRDPERLVTYRETCQDAIRAHNAARKPRFSWRPRRGADKS